MPEVVTFMPPSPPPPIGEGDRLFLFRILSVLVFGVTLSFVGKISGEPVWNHI